MTRGSRGSLTKVDIVQNVFRRVDKLTKLEAIEAVDGVFETLKETLARGETLKISGFGNFEVREKKLRIGRNPQTGEAMEISARRVVTFKLSAVLRAVLKTALIP